MGGVQAARQVLYSPVNSAGPALPSWPCGEIGL